MCDGGAVEVIGWILHSEHPAGYESFGYCTQGPSGLSKAQTIELKKCFESDCEEERIKVRNNGS